MNNLPNMKIANLRDTLSQIDRQICDNYNSQQDSDIRNLIDQRRHILAQIQIEIDSDPIYPQHSNRDAYSINPQTQNIINTWCSRVKHATPSIVSFENEEFCNLFIDQVLPQKWHFDNDAVVIISPPSDHIIKALKNRGQKHIVTYHDGSFPTNIANNIASLQNIHTCKSLEELERLFALLQTPAQQVITISCEADASKSQELRQNISEAVNSGKKTRFENTRTVSKFGQPWAVNVLRNLPALQNARNFHELRVSGVKDAIVVASGPSLNKNVDELRNIQDSTFIVSALRSLPVLNAAGVEPDVVIQLDAEDDEVAKTLTPDPRRPIKNFLIEPTVNSGFLRIPSKQIIWSLAQHFFDIHQKFGTKPTPFNVPSVSIYGLSLCYHLGFKNICFIGQDLAAQGSQQYAQGATDLLPAHAKMSTFNIDVPGFYGGTVRTRNSFNYQIKRCTEIAKEWKNKDPNINLVNATEGGAYIEGFDHMSLNDFANSRNLHESINEKQVWFDVTTAIAATTINDYLHETGSLLEKMMITANQVIKLDNKPEKNRGLQKKIQKTIQKFQALNNQTSLVQIAMQDNIAEVIGTSEKAQKIGTHAEFFKQIKNCSAALQAALDNQKNN